MTLSDLASLGSFVSGVAVLVSLVFLFFQLRQLNAQVAQNTRHARALVWQEATARGVNLMIATADRDLCSAYIRGNGEEPTPDAIAHRQFILQARAAALSIEDLFRQWEDGLMSDARWDRTRRSYPQALATNPGLRRVIEEGIVPGLDTADQYRKFLEWALREAQKLPNEAR
ncbi:MAG TPA: hypothetical protein VKT24_01410 [Rhizomicrobium sp.]|nr:hypothetical protein [Rhizomicrobium sp.]